MVEHARPGEELATHASLSACPDDDEWLAPTITTIAQTRDDTLLPARREVDELKPALELLRDSLVIPNVLGVEVVTAQVYVEHKVEAR
ncbi:hypothetical protein DF146_19180 [Burkholderia cenocepacia]|nr:hypothetical protein DF146_19180 [Burkholderia cenocepacia]